MNTRRVPAANVASPGQRVLAASLNAAITLLTIGVVIAAGVRVYRRSPRARRRLRSVHLPSSISRLGDSPDGIQLPTRWRRAIWAASVAGAVAGRNWRGPGERIVGIRRVDARTGGRVSVCSALIHFAADAGWKRINARVTAPWQRRATQRLRDLAPELKDVQQAHHDDPEAQQRAIMDVYRSSSIKPFTSCLWPLPGMAVPSLPALWSPRRQTAYDWLAGTLVVLQK